MMQSFFGSLFTNKKWLKGIEIHLNNEGIVEKMSYENTDSPQYMLPGFINAHSHAFQYAMAGMAESITGKQDNFWTWRVKMYELALNLDPDDLETIATLLYMEMLRNGYTHVVEFHYLHHDPRGRKYNNPAEMGERLVSAAKTAGIGITLVPMLYMQGGFGKPAEDYQKRFISETVDDYLKLLNETAIAVGQYEQATLAYGVHSLRAVDMENIQRLMDQEMEIPFHIHISEQKSEVEECKDFSGRRPVEYLAEEIGLKANMHLVHATHISENELNLISESGAHVVLCPSTEGNLGDGIFPFREFLEKKGNWSIGSDSHVCLSPMEELRWLDYGQRLISRQRNTYSRGEGTFGENFYDQALRGGYAAAGLEAKEWQAGDYFSGLVLNTYHPMLSGTEEEFLLNALIYTCGSTAISEVWTQGKCRVNNGSHVQQESIRKKFAELMQRLRIRG